MMYNLSVRKISVFCSFALHFVESILIYALNIRHVVLLLRNITTLFLFPSPMHIFLLLIVSFLCIESFVSLIARRRNAMLSVVLVVRCVHDSICRHLSHNECIYARIFRLNSSMIYSMYKTVSKDDIFLFPLQE